ncbi:MAG TPA: CRISPR-associated helicase Cas3' [Aquifex aeolicus]|nr:CRISPR-associated helicase Cas3' [Aquifex aeolicus]
MDGIVFYSHRDPYILLKNHLRDVAGRMIKAYQEQKEFVKLPIDEGFLKNVGIAHDFGKYTSFFQNYIRTREKDIKGRQKHGFISALFGAWLCKEKDDFLPLVAYFVIKHHHGNLKNFEDDLDEDKNRINLEILKEQMEDLRKNKEVISQEYGFDITDFLENWEDVWKLLKRKKFELFESTDSEKKLDVYFTILYTYSLLIDSDRKSASKTEIIKRKELPKDLIGKYRKVKWWDKPKRDIDKLRNNLYKEIKKKLESLKEIPNISTITAPTGLGKTVLNLTVALDYRNRLKNKPRIIYSLPYISIIEQVYNVIDEILSMTLGEEYRKNKSVYLLKHHSLADLKYKKKDEEVPVNEALLLIESWSSEIVITTFVQFLHSVIAFSSSFLKKFHNIAGSIIILDEVQAINAEYWKAISVVLRKLTELLGCKLILSTATRPMIFEEFTELVENVNKYFSSPLLVRTKLVPKVNESKTVEEFAEYVLENLKGESCLIVLNTIKSSIEFYEILKENLTDYEIYYLSTNIIPLQRKHRIRRLKKVLMESKKVVLVSTQVVEAGVNLDFDKVFRDIAPLDAIIQVAGRCNRNKRKDLGIVEIHSLRYKNSDRILAKRVYGSTLVDISKEILKECKEDEYYLLSEEYFRKVKKNKSMQKSIDVLSDIKELRFSGEGKCIARDFKVIEEEPIYTEIFVEINQTARRIYEIFEKEVLEEKDIGKRIENYNRIKKNFRKYILSVPKTLVQEMCIAEDKFPKIPLENVNDHYDKESYGLKLKTGNYFVF